MSLQLTLEVQCRLQFDLRSLAAVVVLRLHFYHCIVSAKYFWLITYKVAELLPRIVLNY